MAKAAFRETTQSGEPATGSFKSGPYSYEFIAMNPGFLLQVKSGGESLASKVRWTFGAGVHGQSYLLEEQGQLYEAQVSSFSSTKQMDLTPGHTEALEGSLQHALGLRLSATDAAHCFSCHTTDWSTDGKLDIVKATPGIHCEACHGPGVNHIDAATNGRLENARRAIFNPEQLTPASSVEFCGSCHRATMDVLLEGAPHGVSGIRFQPYRLEKSRCWESTEDARLTCVACHNPHEPLVRTTSYYDQKCLNCHSPQDNPIHETRSVRSPGNPQVCPKSTTNCTTCHMPRYTVPEMHSQFTDHFIRVVRPGESYPN